MVKTQPPEIQFRNIILHSCNFRADVRPENFQYNLELVGLERKVTDREDGSGSDLLCVYDFDLMYGIEDAPCEFTCTYTAHYFRRPDANMTWDDFNDGMALSHVIAYLREFVMNVTTRSVLPRIFLAPMNAHALAKRYRLRAVEAAKADPSP